MTARPGPAIRSPAVRLAGSSPDRARALAPAWPDGRAEDDEADQPDERHPGESGGERDRRTGQGEHQPVAEPGHPELLHQRFQQEPLGDEPGGQRQPGQRQRADRQPGAAPRQPPGRAAQRVQVVVPASARSCALAVNSSDLAAVCATICKVAASSPAAASRRSWIAAPTSATPNPARISPVFSTLE